MAKDFYQILGVAKSATQDEIKQAFRKLAHTYHPDKAGGDEAKFKEINEAYQVLGDEKKRAQYDQFGSAAFENGGFGFGQGAGGFDFSGFGGAGFEDLGDLFGDLFGGGRRTRARRGADIQIDTQIEFRESVFGTDKTIALTKQSACERCGGTGGEPGTGMETCKTCKGSGVEVSVQRTILGNIQNKRTCSACHGAGEIPKSPCATCHGSGTQRTQRSFVVTVPAGVEDGAVLRVRGEGEFLRGGASGDLYVRVFVKPDARFEREGTHLYSETKIGFTQAALGDTIEVETIDGNVALKIPAGTQSGMQFRLRGKGVQTSHGRGDHLVTVIVITPRKLDRTQRKLLEELGLRE
ncbi:molecular chaperone DnaJ [Candidatus Parcubacteria bacterium]|nr:molecular chaperone DnaJ [Candidatus Parcubacteria bacterium]